MIVSIGSSISSFKTVRFQPGLNVLLADTKPDSTDKQTRNSAGKTSLIEIIHFLLGANCKKDSLFRTDALVNQTFTGEFIFGGVTLTVSRTGSDPSKIFVTSRDGLPAGLVFKLDKSSGRFYVSNKSWKAFLSKAMFRIPEIAQDSEDDETGSLSFRSMFAYFARR
jgi:uncharacterized protein YydD (DUF2326 family)